MQNLQALTQAIARIYSSTLKPEALLYRRANGLQDYDERMAILMQVVEGEAVGSYYFPQLSGVAFSQNQYRSASMAMMSVDVAAEPATSRIVT